MSPRMSPDTLFIQDQLKAGPNFSVEEAVKAAGYWPIAGVDEAGRGPLAGPVVAAAVILDPDHIPNGLNDSKKLSERRREALFAEILSTSVVSIASSSASQIDRVNIRQASLDAMRRAVLHLAQPAHYVLVDGLDIPAGLSCQAKPLVKGDARSLSIAAASIVAKVMRDRMMARAHQAFPVYGFAAHAGYGTAFHKAQIDSHGACALHRMSFRPLRPDEPV